MMMSRRGTLGASRSSSGSVMTVPKRLYLSVPFHSSPVARAEGSDFDRWLKGIQQQPPSSSQQQTSTVEADAKAAQEKKWWDDIMHKQRVGTTVEPQHQEQAAQGDENEKEKVDGEADELDAEAEKQRQDVKRLKEKIKMLREKADMLKKQRQDAEHERLREEQLQQQQQQQKQQETQKPVQQPQTQTQTPQSVASAQQSHARQEFPHKEASDIAKPSHETQQRRTQYPSQSSTSDALVLPPEEVRRQDDKPAQAASRAPSTRKNQEPSTDAGSRPGAWNDKRWDFSEFQKPMVEALPHNLRYIHYIALSSV